MTEQNDTSKKSDGSSPSFESTEKADVRKTQMVKAPRLRAARENEEPALPTDDQSQTPPKEKDPDVSRDTAILSRNNPLLKRALSHQGTTNVEDDTATLVEKREVILLIRGVVERVVMEENRHYRLGRFELGIVRDDEIDLTPYGAIDRGVSRLHAQLHLEKDKLYITDLGSTNGTYLNGTRLSPDEPTLLRKGDDVLLGRLAIQILFR
jgi:pSer/pThr/pTyr-binding forkhead associated (FHA) protein